MNLGTKLKIDKYGLTECSLRNKKDHITYFGYNEIDKINNYDEDTIVDFILPQKYNNEYYNNDKNEGRFFQISYNLNTKSYYIRDLGFGLGTFIKIKDSLLLKDNFLISIGDSCLVINLENINEEKELIYNQNNNFNNSTDSKLQGIGKNLKIKLFEKNKGKKNKEYIFPPNTNKIIRIGRKKHNNDIELEDSLVSKINCNIQYDNDNGWFIKDGNEIRDFNGNIIRKESTNGTWFLAVEDFKIYNGMIFKGNFNLFYCNITKE